MSKGILTSIRNRDTSKLFSKTKSQLLNKNLIDKYKIYRNSLNSLIKSAKSSYYSKNVAKVMKMIWKLINEAPNRLRLKNNDGNVDELY